MMPIQSITNVMVKVARNIVLLTVQTSGRNARSFADLTPDGKFGTTVNRSRLAAVAPNSYQSVLAPEAEPMNTLNTPWILIAGVIAAGLIALSVWFSYHKKQSRKLHDRFGLEYDRTVEDLGSRAKAESELKTRERRVDLLNITALTAAEAARFSASWNTLQGRFVDNPQSVVIQADQLVRELMVKRGYPMENFERRAADISVDHPAVVHNYRAAQALMVLSQGGKANTEELRQAVVHYRALFDELLEVKESTVAAASRQPAPVAIRT